MIRKNNDLEKVDLGQKTEMLNYRTSMSKHFEGLHRQCTFCLLGLALSLNRPFALRGHGTSFL